MSLLIVEIFFPTDPYKPDLYKFGFCVIRCGLAAVLNLAVTKNQRFKHIDDVLALSVVHCYEHTAAMG